MKEFLSRGKKLLFSPQSSILSAATIIMIMIIASRLLGLVRQRTLAHFFTASELSPFFAAFRLPDLIFEVLVFGTFSSAFIPVFTRAIKAGNKKAWEIASTVTNIGLLVYAFFAILVMIFADNLYGILAPGFSLADRQAIVTLSRILFAAQGFFVVSYVLTAVLESLQRFLVPALAPLFYNLGIILGTYFFSSRLGILAPAIGVAIGAACHFLIQLPLAFKMGFRFKFRISLTPEVRRIGKLALPRIIEVSFLQVTKTVELFLASLLSTASYTYFTFANTLQLLPVGLFGTSIAKAALPTLSKQAGTPAVFRKTLFSTLNQIIFLIAPVATILIVLRIPLVRLVFGTDIFSWESTVQTGMVVSAFAVSIVFQASSSILARGFYALHDTKTPVVISIASIFINIIFDFVLIRILGLPVWGLAGAFSLGSLIQASLLTYAIIKKIGLTSEVRIFSTTIKTLIASFGSGLVMFILLKIFDRSVWVKRLSFLGALESSKFFPFEKFVLDTRYTFNLLILTCLVSFVGISLYLVISLMLKSEEVGFLAVNLRRIFIKRGLPGLEARKSEPVTPSQSDSSTGT